MVGIISLTSPVLNQQTVERARTLSNKLFKPVEGIETDERKSCTINMIRQRSVSINKQESLEVAAEQKTTMPERGEILVGDLQEDAAYT